MRVPYKSFINPRARLRTKITNQLAPELTPASSGSFPQGMRSTLKTYLKKGALLVCVFTDSLRAQSMTPLTSLARLRFTGKASAANPRVGGRGWRSPSKGS
jgi:hypothetical protein